MSELTDYLASLADPERSAVSAVYDRARALVPEATDGVGYGMPALRYLGKPLLAVQATAGHLAFYPFSPAAIDGVRDDLAGFSTGKGTVRFSVERPIPADALDRIILARRAQIEG